MAFPGAVHRHVEEAEPEICADMLQHLLVPCKRSMRGLQEDARSPSMHNRTMQGSLPPVDQTQASEVFQELHSLKAQGEVKLMKSSVHYSLLARFTFSEKSTGHRFKDASECNMVMTSQRHCNSVGFDLPSASSSAPCSLLKNP